MTIQTKIDNDTGSCRSWLAVLQLVIGVLLVTASAFAYTLMPHPVLLVPSLMGAALLYQGARSFLVCRHRPVLSDHHHSTAG